MTRGMKCCYNSHEITKSTGMDMDRCSMKTRQVKFPRISRAIRGRVGDEISNENFPKTAISPML